MATKTANLPVAKRPVSLTEVRRQKARAERLSLNVKHFEKLWAYVDPGGSEMAAGFRRNLDHLRLSPAEKENLFGFYLAGVSVAAIMGDNFARRLPRLAPKKRAN